MIKNLIDLIQDLIAGPEKQEQPIPVLVEKPRKPFGHR